MFLCWHKQVPLKASISAWRLLQNRLPTKENLVMRGIIPHDSRFCVTWRGATQSAHHMFLYCPSFAFIWGLVRLQIGVESADLGHVSDHFVQFMHSLGGPRSRRSFMQLLWLCCVWVIWIEHNNKLFKNMENTAHQLLEKVKLHSFWWLKACNETFGSNFHMWWSGTFVCMCIG